jgi:hypothetical protein
MTTIEAKIPEPVPMPGNIGSVFAGGRFFPIRMMTSFWSWPWPPRHSILLRITCATSQALKPLAWKQ